jgi:hypothetical protein
MYCAKHKNCAKLYLYVLYWAERKKLRDNSCWKKYFTNLFFSWEVSKVSWIFEHFLTVKYLGTFWSRLQEHRRDTNEIRRKWSAFPNFLRENNFSQSDLRFGKSTFWSFVGRQRKKNLEVVFSGSSFHKYTTSLILCIYKYILYIHRDGHVCRSGNRRYTSDYLLPPSSDFLAPIVAIGGLCEVPLLANLPQKL